MAFEDRPEWKPLVALGVGLVLGLERERARGAERPRRWAGLRTFALTSLLGGVALQTGSAVVVGVSGASNAVTKVVLAATSGPLAYLVRVLAGQLAVMGATWAGWLLGRP